jgi:hypothetical protein
MEGIMPELVRVANVERLDGLRSYINEQFEKNHFAEIVQAVGMYSLLIDPEHTLGDQDELYRLVLDLLKNKIRRDDPKTYSEWLSSFPSLLDQLVEKGEIIVDAAAQMVLASHRSSYGPFASLDAFYFWALDDRRLPLDQIIRYVMKTVEIARSS